MKQYLDILRIPLCLITNIWQSTQVSFFQFVSLTFWKYVNNWFYNHIIVHPE